MKKVYILAAIAAFVLLAEGCDKQKYRGPRGGTGPQGAQGPAGPAGQDAEVTSSGDFVVADTAWSNLSGGEWRAAINSGLVTGAAVQRGSVQVLINTGAAWYTLPYFDHSVYTTFGYEPGTVYLITADSHGALPPKPQTATYKVIVVLDSDIKTDKSKNNFRDASTPTPE